VGCFLCLPSSLIYPTQSPGLSTSHTCITQKKALTPRVPWGRKRRGVGWTALAELDAPPPPCREDNWGAAGLFGDPLSVGWRPLSTVKVWPPPLTVPRQFHSTPLHRPTDFRIRHRLPPSQEKEDCALQTRCPPVQGWQKGYCGTIVDHFIGSFLCLPFAVASASHGYQISHLQGPQTKAWLLWFSGAWGEDRVTCLTRLPWVQVWQQGVMEL
jgi:hypothetical protein